MGASANNQSSSKYVGSEGSSGGSSDGQCSSPMQSSEDDDNVSDEDLRVDEAEMHTVCCSDSSESSFVSENEGKSKRKAKAKKINERFLDEDIQSRAGIDEEIQSSDEFDDEYLQFLSCHHGSSSSSSISIIQGGNAEIFGSSVNVGKRKRGRPRKNRSLGFAYEADDRAISDNHYCSRNGSFTQSSPLPCRLNSKSGATKKRGRPPKNTIEVIGSESEAEKDSIGEFAKSEYGGNRKKGRLSHFEDINDGDELYLKWLRNLELSGRCDRENGGNRKRGRPPKGMNLGVDSKPENQLKPMNAGYRKTGRPPKKTIVETEAESESQSQSKNDLVGALHKSENGSNRKRGRLPHFEDINDGDELYLEWLRSHGLSGGCGNAGNRKRGRPPKGMNVGVDSEPENDVKPMNGGYQKRGRPPTKIIVETESESKSQSENDLVGPLRKSENGGNRERGKRPQFEDVEDGDEMYLRGPSNLKLSGRSEKGDNSKRGRPQKGMIVGVGSEPKNDSYRQKGRLPKNGGYGKRGRPPKNWNKGFDSERGCKSTIGRPPKNLNKGFNSGRGCRRSRRLQTISRK